MPFPPVMGPGMHPASTTSSVTTTPILATPAIRRFFTGTTLPLEFERT